MEKQGLKKSSTRCLYVTWEIRKEEMSLVLRFETVVYGDLVVTSSFAQREGLKPHDEKKKNEVDVIGSHHDTYSGRATRDGMVDGSPCRE